MVERKIMIDVPRKLAIRNRLSQLLLWQSDRRHFNHDNWRSCSQLLDATAVGTIPSHIGGVGRVKNQMGEAWNLRCMIRTLRSRKIDQSLKGHREKFRPRTLGH